MSHPRKFRQPMRLIVLIEAQTVNAMGAYMVNGGNHRHRNRSDFVRQAIEREIRRC